MWPSSRSYAAACCGVMKSQPYERSRMFHHVRGGGWTKEGGDSRLVTFGYIYQLLFLSVDISTTKDSLQSIYHPLYLFNATYHTNQLQVSASNRCDKGNGGEGLFIDCPFSPYIFGWTSADFPVASAQPETFGFQAEISQLLDLIISSSFPTSMTCSLGQV